MTGRTFVAEIGGSRLITVPKKFASHHDIQPEDSLELRVVSHKRDGEVIYEEPTNES